MDGLMDAVLVARTVVLRYRHAGTHRQTHTDVDDQVDQRPGGTYRRQSRLSIKLPHYNVVRRIVQQLQHPGSNQRQAEPDDIRNHGTVYNVDPFGR